MKIVVLDGYTLNPGDLSWEGLKELGDVVVYDRTPESQVIERASGAEIVLTNKSIVFKKQIDNLPALKYIGVMATGMNVVDLVAAKERNIVVTNVAGYSTDSVAQHVMALLLGLINKVAYYDQTVKNGDWTRSKDFSYWDGAITELAGKKMGIIGFGAIGKRTAELARAFGMEIISFHKHPERDKQDWVEFLPLEEVFASADVVSLHCPLNESNKGFVNRELLKIMKSNAIVINTARGPLINHDDLSDALERGVIAGAGLDVFDVEPPPEVHPVFRNQRCIVTPHQAWATFEARKRLMNGVIQNVKNFLGN
ncbi:MAG: D-2-hydroxyacid dehydrogenase [Cyclobacteriaceae bacterium]|nr:D-2-hydroxyacid dehydrogenase [Cyclobacteriaceae bacterium]